MRMSLRSTSTRTFVALPLALLAEQAIRRAPVHAAAAPLLAAGYAAYKAAGSYRIGRAGGPPGMSQGMPDRLVTTGVYAWTRNPMYLGMLLALAGVALALGTLSPWLLVLQFFVLAQCWYIPLEERKLAARFGRQYADYCRDVRRWI